MVSRYRGIIIGMAMTLRLPPDLEATLNAYSVATGATMAGVVRMAVDEFLDRELARDPDVARRVEAIKDNLPPYVEET